MTHDEAVALAIEKSNGYGDKPAMSVALDALVRGLVVLREGGYTADALEIPLDAECEHAALRVEAACVFLSSLMVENTGGLKARVHRVGLRVTMWLARRWKS